MILFMICRKTHFIRNRGNILFLILLAVVLFAALTYAVTQSMRGGGKDSTSETYKTQASQILQKASLIENTFGRMTLTGGFKDYEIEMASSAPYNLNSNCTSVACRLFDPANGNLESNILYLPNSMKNPIFPGSNLTMRPILSAVQGVGTSAPDVVLLLEGLKPGICSAINDLQGITGTPVYNDSNPGVSFKLYSDTSPAGGFGATTSAIGEEVLATQLVGKSYGCGCYQADCGNLYDARFYYVIYAR